MLDNTLGWILLVFSIFNLIGFLYVWVDVRDLPEDVTREIKGLIEKKGE